MIQGWTITHLLEGLKHFVETRNYTKANIKYGQQKSSRAFKALHWLPLQQLWSTNLLSVSYARDNYFVLVGVSLTQMYMSNYI